MAGSQGIRAGAAYVELFAEDSKLVRGLARARVQLRQFGRAVETIGAGMKTAGTWMMGLGAALVTPLAAAAKSFSDTGYNLLEMSKRTGMSVEALSELGFAAMQSGGDLETLEAGIRRMQRMIGEAATGSTAAATALAELGLSASQLLTMTPEEQFSAIAEALSRIPDSTLRAAAAMRVFGRGGTSLLPMVERGAAGIAELRAEAQRLGLTISTDDAEAAREFHNTLSVLWAAVKRVAFEVGGALAPTLKEAAKWLIDAAGAATRWIKEHQGLIVLAFEVGAGLAVAGAALFAFGHVVATIGGAITAVAAAIGVASTVMTTLAGIVGAMLTPVGAAIAVAVALGVALVALGGYALYASGALGQAVAWIADRFGFLKDDALAAIGGIADALASGDIGLAARILWLTLKLEWQRGVSFLTGYWLDWKRAFLDTATDAFYGLQALWTIVGSGLEKAWTETIAMLQTVWTVFTGLVALGWNALLNKLGVRTDAEAAAARARIVGETDAALSGIDAKEKQQLAANEAARQKALAEIGGKSADARRRHAADAARDLKAAEDELAAAKKAWEDALAAARAKRAGEAPAAPGKPKPFDAFAFLPSSLEDVQRRVGIAGSFNAAAAWGLVGVGSIERIAKATEQTASNTKAIVDDMGDGATFD